MTVFSLLSSFPTLVTDQRQKRLKALGEAISDGSDEEEGEVSGTEQEEEVAGEKGDDAENDKEP